MSDFTSSSWKWKKSCPSVEISKRKVLQMESRTQMWCHPAPSSIAALFSVKRAASSWFRRTSPAGNIQAAQRKAWCGRPLQRWCWRPIGINACMCLCVQRWLLRRYTLPKAHKEVRARHNLLANWRIFWFGFNWFWDFVYRWALRLLLLPAGCFFPWIHLHPWRVVTGNPFS